MPSPVQSFLNKSLPFTEAERKPSAFDKYKVQVEKSFSLLYGVPIYHFTNNDYLQEAFNNGIKARSLAIEIGKEAGLSKR